MIDLAETIANWRAEARVLERNGEEGKAAILERCATEAFVAAEKFITFVSEADAQLHSGRAKDWLRKQFPRWLREGVARWDPTNRRQRQYLLIILPRRTDIEAIRANAIDEARKVAS